MQTMTLITRLLDRGTIFFRGLLTPTITSTPVEHSSLDAESTTARPSPATTETTPETKTDPNRSRTQPKGIQKKDPSLHPIPSPLSGGT
jgi:hypothetical protein